MKNIPIVIFRKWLNERDTEQLNIHLSRNIKWEQPEVKIFGRTYLTPRLTAFFAIIGVAYNYSGVNHFGSGWPGWRSPLLYSVNNFCKTDFNGCLINLYRDGNDCMGWHSDNEKEIDEEHPIASLSLGSKRDFIIKHKIKNIKEVVSLENGDLLIMYPF